jgi:hypothetical protein
LTLDLARVVGEIEQMVSGVDPTRDAERFAALRCSWAKLDERDVNTRLHSARTSFLLARAERGYRARHPQPPIPDDYTVVATDGSMVVPNRHSPARFYLLNIGKVRLQYGGSPRAHLTAEPELRYEEADLYVPRSVRRIPINEVVLGLRRATAELLAASELLDGIPGPALALLDGTLILWSLEAQDQAVVDWVLPEYLAALRAFQSRSQPVASYISAPGAAELMNTLRVSICDYPSQDMTVNCDHCRARIMSEARTPACDVLPGVPDRYLLEQIARLEPGQRTTVFTSDSRILQQYGDDQRICFFYLHAGREVSRVEIPAWVAADSAHLDLVHAIVIDQCRLGRGYPVALQEAHEQAVLSSADRRLVEELVERRLASLGVVMTRTGKEGSKRGRFV